MSMELIGRAEALKHSYLDYEDEKLPTVKAIPIEVVEQIRNEIENLSTDAYITDGDGVTSYGRRSLTAEELKEQVFEIIDKALKEQTT